MNSTLPRSKGFTLIEVIVALTVTAMLLLVVYGSLHTGIRAHRSIGVTVEGNEQVRSINYFLRRQFRRVETDLHDESFRFIGDRHALRYALRGLRGDPSLYLFYLRAVPESSPRYLEVAIQRVEGSPGRPVSTNTSSRIGDDLRGVDFAYFGPADSRTDAVWRDHWESSEYPPQLVRIRFRQHDGGERALFLSVAGADGNQTTRYRPFGDGES